MKNPLGENVIARFRIRGLRISWRGLLPVVAVNVLLETCDWETSTLTLATGDVLELSSDGLILGSDS